FYARKETFVATSKLPASWSNKNKIGWLERGASGALSRGWNRAAADTGVNFGIWSAGRSKAEQAAWFKKNCAPAGRGGNLRSNRKKIEWLERGAYEALSRALNRAVADTGVNFSIWSAGRSKAEQVALFKKNYAPAGRGRKLKSDRSYAGKIWARKPGGVNVASPDLGSNHEDGRAVDIHPAAIQNWFKRNGRLYGWSWDEGRRVGENWHFRYVPSLDQMKHEGLLDHAAVQRVVGATVDGKIGTGTVAKIKAWQKAHGLTADGKVGAGTKRAMGLTGKGDAAPAPVIPVGPVGGASVPVPQPADLVIEEAGPAKNAYDDRKGHSIKHATIHWWGRPSGQSFEGIRDYLIDNPREVSAHYVVSGTRVARILPEDRGAWGNGDRTANLEGI